MLAGRERWGRTMEWDAKRDAAVAAVTVDQVNAAFKKHISPLAISIVKGGDFKKAGVYQ
jgi:zinc protease